MNHIRKIFRAAAILLIFVSLVSIGTHYYNRWKTEKMYEKIGETAFTEPETEPAPTIVIEQEEETEPEYVSPVDFESLWEINPEVVGWIKVPDTRIDYPILYHADNNEKYLHMDLEGNESVSGAIYLDFQDEPDFSSLHNVIYGHHMKNGTMFKDVMKFREQEFFNEHQEIYLYLPDREVVLKPFACLYTNADGSRRKTEFSDEAELQEYVEEMTSDAGVYREPEQPVKKLYSLVTCSYEFNNARTILYCYEEE